MPAENDEILGKGKSICHRLIELLTIGGRKDNLVVIPLGLQGVDTPLYRLYLHDHSGKAAKRIIVYTTVLIFRIITKIMDMYLCKPFILSTFHDGAVKESLNHLWQNCDNVNAHITLF